MSGLANMDSLQGWIFDLYIVQDRTLAQVLARLQTDHDLKVSRRVLLKKLHAWGYLKNLKRSEAMQIVRETERRTALAIGGVATLHGRPVEMSRVQRHAERAGISRLLAASAATSQNVVDRVETGALRFRTPPPPLTQPLLFAEHWRVPEKLLFDIDALVKGSFETGQWVFKSSELIIDSSPHQVAEVQVLHDFLSDLERGCAAADTGNHTLAGGHWRRAFIALEQLITAQYHDIIPNLVQQITDMNRQGRTRLADMLKTHIADCGQKFLLPQDAHLSIFSALRQLDMAYVADLEERIMKQFEQLFLVYLGPQCYNTFVVTMDGARRRLFQNPWVRPEDCLPPVSRYDALFGPTDRKTMDVIALRLEVLGRRAMYQEVEEGTYVLIQRAEAIQDDRWQRLFNLVRGWFMLGQAQFFLGKREPALVSLSTMLAYEAEFNTLIHSFNMFNPQRTLARGYLEQLQVAIPQEAPTIVSAHAAAPNA